MSSPPKLSLKEAAKRLNRTYVTTLGYVNSGKLRAHKEGGFWAILESEVERFEREGNYQDPQPQQMVQEEEDDGRAQQLTDQP